MTNKFVDYLNLCIQDTLRKTGCSPQSISCDLGSLAGIDNNLFSGQTYRDLSERLRLSGWTIAMKHDDHVIIAAINDHPDLTIR